MKKVCVIFVFLLMSTFYAKPAAALTLSIEPAIQSLALNDTTVIDVRISDLGSFAAPSLGAFDIDIGFDDAVLDLDSIMINTLLGDVSLGVAVTGVTTAPGSLSVFEVSLLTSAQLDALQPSSFTLFSMNFTADTLGNSVISFGDVVLSDTFGNGLTDFQVSPATVGVVQNVVPEPMTMFLFGSGLVGAFVRRR